MIFSVHKRMHWNAMHTMHCIFSFFLVTARLFQQNSHSFDFVLLGEHVQNPANQLLLPPLKLQT
jgi:hypothetical protein